MRIQPGTEVTVRIGKTQTLIGKVERSRADKEKLRMREYHYLISFNDATEAGWYHQSRVEAHSQLSLD